MEIVIEDEAPVTTKSAAPSSSSQIVIEDDVPASGEPVRQALAVSTTPPEEAAQNINRSKLFNVTPDAYKNNKEALDADAIAFENVPSTLGPKTKEFIEQGEQHASLASTSLDKMNSFEKRVEYAKQKIIDIPEKQREMNEIVSEIMDTPDGKIDPAKQAHLDSLRTEVRGMTASAEAYGIGDKEDFVYDVLSAGGDIIRSYTDNKALIAATVGGSTAVGAGVGATLLGIGAVPGATLGFTKGAIGANILVGMVDGYKQTSRGLYNELAQTVDENGKPIPHQKMVNVSQAVGALSGVVSGIAGKVFASNNPFLKRFLNPKLAASYIGKTPALMAKMDILGGIAKSAFAEGGEEGFQEFVQIVGKAFGQLDDSESSFTNAIDAITSESQKSDTWKQVGKSTFIGGVTGGVMQTVASAPGYKGLKDRYTEVEYVTKRKTEVLEAQNNMVELAHEMKNTKMNDLSPNEMSNFTKKVFSSLGVDENVFMHIEDVRKFGDSPEKAAAIKKAIDPTGQMTKMSQELNIPMEIPKADFLKIMTEFPEVSDFMMLQPDGENPLQIRNEGKDFADKLVEADQKRAALMDQFPEGMTAEQEAQYKKEVTASVRDSKYFSSRESYLDQSAIQPIDGVVNAKEAADLSAAQLDARLAIDAVTVAPVDARFDKYENYQFKTDTEQDIALEVKKLEKEYSTIDNFSRIKDLNEVDAKTVSEHKKKGFSAFAIDPKSLPEDLKAIYLENPDLKKRKAFVDGGIHIEESAILNGFESGAELLKALAETPTKKQLETRIKNDPLREHQKRQEIQASMEATKIVARDEAFTRLTKAHLKEMDYMTKKEWPTLKRGIIKIAKKAPTIEALNTEAKSTISKLQIKNINPNMFKTGENKSQQLAVKQFVDGQFEAAFDSKEKAALNNEMRKEALKAQDKIERYQKFWKKAKDPSFIQELKDAGMNETMNEFMSLYKLDGNIRSETEQKSFNKFVTDQAALGNYVPVVPERLSNTQASYKDLTVEQYQIMTEMGQFISNQAKLKNKLIADQAARNELRTAETIAEDVEKYTTSHVDYDPKRGERKNERYLSVTEGWKQGLTTTISAFESVKSIVLKLDNYQLDGYFHNLIGKPIKEARTALRQESLQYASRDHEVFKEFYGNDLNEIHSFISVPEFADIPSLGDGKGNIRKADLLVIQAYMGDPNARELIPNFTDRQGQQILTVEAMQKILDTHLTENDASFTQNLLNDRFKPLGQRSVDLHKRTAGVDAELVDGIPTVHRGKVRPGGYYPIRYQLLQDEVRASNMLEDLKSSAMELGLPQEGHFFAKMASAGMTQQGRLKERQGSQRPLDVTFENFIGFTNEALHDLHFREVGIDALKVLKNPMNVKNMKAVIGPKSFVALLNGVKDVVSKTTERESTLFGDQQAAINKWIDKGHSVHAMKTIGFNVASAAIQPASLANLTLRVGPKASIYLAKHAQKIALNLSHYDSYVKLAGEINPDIQLEKDGMDNTLVKDSYDWMPVSNSFFKKYKNGSNKTINGIRKLQKDVTNASFAPVREVDRGTKVLATLAITDQFLSGDVPGFPLEMVQKMSDSEKAERCRSIVQQAIDTSLTASATEDKTPIEKNKVTSIFTRYFTDRRAGLNSIIAQIDKAKGSFKKGNNAQGVKHVLTLGLATGISSAFIAAIRNDEESIIKKLQGVDDGESAAEFAKDMVYNFALAPLDQTLSYIPFVDNIKYQAELKNIRGDYRNVSTPLMGVGSDIASGVVIMKDILKAALQGHKHELTDTQRKIILTNVGYGLGGAPTNTMFKAYQALDNKYVNDASKYLKGEIEDLHKTIDDYIDTFKDEPDADKFIEDLKEYKKELPQFDADVKNIIPENTKETLKTALSGGQWSKFDKVTGAAGIYQFTEQRWKDLQTLNPDLGLTDNGRVAKDPSQQEKAMDFEIADNTRGLLTYQILVNEENLLGAHKFGIDNFIAIHDSKEGEKLSAVLGEEAKNPIFKDFKTAGEVKKYLSSKVK